MCTQYSGALLARQFEEIWRVLGSPHHITLRELGPGRGLFAQDVLDRSEKKFPDFYRALHYALEERSPALRQRIETNLGRHIHSRKAQLISSASLDTDAASIPVPAAERRQNAAHGASRGSVGQHGQAPKGRKNADLGASKAPRIVFANEFFDALPVEIVSPQGSLRIDARAGRFVETWAPPSSEELEFLDRYSIHPEPGERVEVPLQSQMLHERCSQL